MRFLIRLVALLALIGAIAPAQAQLNASSTYLGSVSAAANIVVNGIPGVVLQNDLLGVPIRLTPSAPNSGALSANFNGLGLQPIKKPTRGGLATLTGGEIQDQMTVLIWDGAEYVCVTCVNTYKLPTFSLLTSGTATYTTPAGATQLEIWQIGGGGGGANASASGSAGGTTTFGSTTAAGGGASTNAGPSVPGAGGSGGTTGTGTTIQRLTGGGGLTGQQATNGGVSFSIVLIGGAGCPSQFASQAGSNLSASPPSVVANTGSGGSGSWNQASGAGSFTSFAGGGCGEFVHYYINAPSATYSYTIGAGGAAGGSPASAGSSGVIVIRESYN